MKTHFDKDDLAKITITPTNSAGFEEFYKNRKGKTDDQIQHMMRERGRTMGTLCTDTRYCMFGHVCSAGTKVARYNYLVSFFHDDFEIEVI